MVIRNKPTFDPYSLTDFQAKDALKSGVKTWRSHKWSCLTVALIAALPALTVELIFDNPQLTLFISALMIPQAVTAISPLIARDARGLRTDIRSSLRIMRERLPAVLTISLMISSVVAAPALILLFVGKFAGIAGLIFGALAASPLALSLPITVTESVGMLRSIKRSLFLIKGRLLPALGAIFVCIAIASVGAAVRFITPDLALYGFLVEPLLVSWASVGLGALYLHLYDR